jgi:predicted phosphodiesterase
MRVLVLSDIHSNMTALEAVLKDAGSVDEIWCLGDMIGYGPDPNAVLERLHGLPNLTCCLLGNHDVALLGDMNFAVFNTEARKSLIWQQESISAENLAHLRTLPQDTLVREKVTLAHGSPRDPVWEYILNTLVARLNFEAFETPYCFVGHSHIQCYFQLDLTRDRVSLEIPPVNHVVKLSPRAILNPGVWASRETATHMPLMRFTIPQRRPGSRAGCSTISKRCRSASGRRGCPKSTPRGWRTVGNFTGRDTALPCPYCLWNHPAVDNVKQQHFFYLPRRNI